jgi:hypothetical protein
MTATKAIVNLSDMVISPASSLCTARLALGGFYSPSRSAQRTVNDLLGSGRFHEQKNDGWLLTSHHSTFAFHCSSDRNMTQSQ